MLRIFTLLAGTVETVSGKYVGAATAIIGLATLLGEAGYLILENRNIIDALDSEVKDIPEMAEGARRRAGGGDERRWLETRNDEPESRRRAPAGKRGLCIAHDLSLPTRGPFTTHWSTST